MIISSMRSKFAWNLAAYLPDREPWPAHQPPQCDAGRGDRSLPRRCAPHEHKVRIKSRGFAPGLVRIRYGPRLTGQVAKPDRRVVTVELLLNHCALLLVSGAG